MFLAGDVGGTNTRLARVTVRGGSYEVASIAVYESTRYPGLEPILGQYLREHPAEAPIAAAGFGIPGPVEGRVARTTNLPWAVDADALERQIGAKVALCNDLEAAAHGVLVLESGAMHTLQDGEERPGNRVVIAAGTGLGQAILFHRDGTLWPSPSEGGHTEFGPRDDEEAGIWRFARERFGHVSYERLVSGAGLVLLYEYYAARFGVAAPPWAADEDPAAGVTRAARGGGDPAAAAALRRFCMIYGAEAGNLALKALALGGVYVAGGIAPKILDVLKGGAFLEAFLEKGRYRALLSRIPVRVVLDEAVGLRGAARAARLALGQA